MQVKVQLCEYNIKYTYKENNSYEDISCFNLQWKISKKLQHITSYPSNIKQYDTV